MNARHARFVQEYLVDRNGAGAAIRAGYSRRTAASIAHELLRKPEVDSAVRKGEAKLAKDAKLNRAAVLKGFKDAIELARLQGDASAMIAGWREIAKMCGYYAPERKQIELSAAALASQQEIEDMTDAELTELIAGGSSQYLEPSTSN